MLKSVLAFSVVVAAGTASAQSFADLSAGTIDGDGVANGSTVGVTSIYNGRFGLEDGTGIYGGGDQVWTILHGGGSLDIELLFDDAAEDLDIFLYDQDLIPSIGDEVGLSLGFTTLESISGDYDAGTYYLLVDTFSDIGSSYTVTVDGTPIPAPAALSVLGFAAAFGRRRR